MNKNKREINILVDEGFNNDYLNFLNGHFNVVNVTDFADINNKMFTTKVDLIVFTGGEDVSPMYYNENKGSKTFNNEVRDRLAFDIYNRYLYTPKLGICRGSQALTVFNGGKLIQHVEGHTQSHLCDMFMGGELLDFEISSTHHQMMFPYNLDKNKYEIIAWSKKYMSNVYLNGNDEQISLPEKFLEPEIVYFKNTKSLAIQGHPEFNSVNNRTKSIIYDLIDQKLFNNNNNW